MIALTNQSRIYSLFSQNKNTILYEEKYLTLTSLEEKKKNAPFELNKII